MKTKEDFEFQNNLSWMIDWLEVLTTALMILK